MTRGPRERTRFTSTSSTVEKLEAELHREFQDVALYEEVINEGVLIAPEPRLRRPDGKVAVHWGLGRAEPAGQDLATREPDFFLALCSNMRKDQRDRRSFGPRFWRRPGRRIQPRFFVAPVHLLRRLRLELRATQRDLDEKRAWALELDRELEERRKRILELQEDLEEKNAWLQDLETQSETRGRKVLELQAELEGRTRWARELEAEANRRAEQVSRLEARLRSDVGALRDP